MDRRMSRQLENTMPPHVTLAWCNLQANNMTSTVNMYNKHSMYQSIKQV